MSEIAEYHPLPQPEEISTREKEDAMGSYLMMFAALGAGLPLPMLNILAAFIYYFLHKSKGRFVRFHVLQSLWSQIPTSLLNGAVVIWTIRIIFEGGEFSSAYLGLLAITVLINIIYFAVSIYAAVQARKGRFYYFLFFGRLAYHQVFQVKDEESEYVRANPSNKPPV
jgi:uncharacterized membrane protein